MLPRESGPGDSKEADGKRDTQDDDEERFGCTLRELEARLHHADWNVRRELLYMVRETARKGDKRVSNAYSFVNIAVPSRTDDGLHA
jgi:hypothetical protein